MSAMHSTSPAAAKAQAPIIRTYMPPAGAMESFLSAALRVALKVTIKPFLGPPWPFAVQRMALANGAALMPQDKGAVVEAGRIGPFTIERVRPKAGPKPKHAILYIHGGAFVAGSPKTHRTITRRLAVLTGAEVLAPHYRLAPEHVFPAQIDDCLASYRQLLADGYTPDRISIAGDSAGGHLTLVTWKAIEMAGLPVPASLVMISPAFSLHELPNGTAEARIPRDPMIRLAWAEDVEKAMKADPKNPLANPMGFDLSTMPPAMVQVGDDEVLYDNSVWLAKAAAEIGRHCECEIYMQRWHVFHAHAGLLKSSDQALERMAAFMKKHWVA